jgi:ribosomal protein L11 methyltransferase
MWLAITVDTEPRFEERLSSAFEDLGAVAVTLLDAADQPIYEPGPGETPLWRNLTMQALFPGDSDEAGIVFGLSALQPGLDMRRVHVQRIEDQDWERAWMDDFKPMRFGARLWIVPTTHELPDEASGAGAAVIRLDPGLAFGTGTHATTALCLEWLDGQTLDGQRVLDFGCGSGVLAIAAAHLGAARVVATDNDPQALTATADNATANAVQGTVDIVPSESWSPAGDNEVVVANILANTLIELAPRLVAAMAPGGRIALSGILPEQADQVTAAYAALGVALERRDRDGWVLLATPSDTFTDVAA